MPLLHAGTDSGMQTEKVGVHVSVASGNSTLKVISTGNPLAYTLTDSFIVQSNCFIMPPMLPMSSGATTQKAMTGYMFVTCAVLAMRGPSPAAATLTLE